MAYLLSVEQVLSMSEYIEEQLNIANGCDHSRKHLMQWLNDNIEQEKIPSVIEEMNHMGGFCDCEVLMNCYEDYDEELISEDDQ